jgi:hypothetical protein
MYKCVTYYHLRNFLFLALLRRVTIQNLVGTHRLNSGTASVVCGDGEEQDQQVFLKKCIDASEVIFRDSVTYTRSGKLAL